MNKIIIFVIAIAIFLQSASNVLALESTEAGMSARPNFTAVEVDTRAIHLKSYLTSINSPLTPSADHFVMEADRLNLDWRLVVAIAGVESTFGQHIPTGSYNGWGWGVFTGTADGKHFASWEEGITQVSEGLRYNYIDKGARTIDQIGRIYAASPAWSFKVKHFLYQIDAFSPNHSEDLAVTI